MNTGSPPTERNARTGLLTPPGRRRVARAIKRAERSITSATLASILSPLPCNNSQPLSKVSFPFIPHSQPEIGDNGYASPCAPVGLYMRLLDPHTIWDRETTP